MSTELKSIGVIAGNRSLPLIFARQARAMGVERIVAVAFEGETEPALAELVDEIIWLKVGQLERMIQAFKSRGITKCVMVGQIAPKNLFDLRPDLRAMTLLLRLKEKNAHTIFGAIADELLGEGIKLIEATPWLEPIMPGDGFAIGEKLTDEQRKDVGFGFKIAKAISKLDIGQTVVVKNGVVLAVEAFEGTDKCLERGGSLCGKGSAVAVKVAKEKHDMRFDIPCIGAQTIKTCANYNIGVLAVEAKRTLILEEELVRELVKKHRVSLIAVSERGVG